MTYEGESSVRDTHDLKTDATELSLCHQGFWGSDVVPGTGDAGESRVPSCMGQGVVKAESHMLGL